MSADGKRIWPRSGPREGAEPAKEMEKKQAGRQAGRRRAGVPRRREDTAVSQTGQEAGLVSLSIPCGASLCKAHSGTSTHSIAAMPRWHYSIKGKGVGTRSRSASKVGT